MLHRSKLLFTIRYLHHRYTNSMQISSSLQKELSFQWAIEIGEAIGLSLISYHKPLQSAETWHQIKDCQNFVDLVVGQKGNYFRATDYSKSPRFSLWFSFFPFRCMVCLLTIKEFEKKKCCPSIFSFQELTALQLRALWVPCVTKFVMLWRMGTSKF